VIRRRRGGPAEYDVRLAIDGCETCHTYLKSFDLRQRGARDVVQLVDDVATASLDLRAESQGFRRVTPSLVGM
jgi:formate dehydrogenase maturation protein FdhE